MNSPWIAASSIEPPLAWERILDSLRHEFLPIVKMRTGRVHGVEAVLGGFEHTPFADTLDLFEAADAEDCLAAVQAAVHRKAVAACRREGVPPVGRLFLNVDIRALEPLPLPWPGGNPVAGPGIVLEIAQRLGVPAAGRRAADVESMIRRLRDGGFGVGLDDFGSGSAGPRLLYEAQPDYVKIDAFFIAGIDRDLRKRAIVHALIGYAHTLGVLVVAQGVTVAAEFYLLRDLGCDFAQGDAVGPPVRDVTEIGETAPLVEALNRQDRRKPRDQGRLTEVIERLEPLPSDSPKARLLDYFRVHDAQSIAPVVNAEHRPIGLVRERDLKRFVYSRFGNELLRNRGLGNTLGRLIVATPVCDIATPLDQVVEAFSSEEASDGIIIVEGGEYAGFLSPAALLRLVHERNITIAKDQNPLTLLPGNAAIVRHIEEALADQARFHLLVYLDFDNFKPFNDHYGFRQGDRAILMFAERLKTLAATGDAFAGHIGGDDFFLALHGGGEPQAVVLVRELLEQFRSDAESLYDAAAREQGGIVAKDRYGNLRLHPMLTVSGVAIAVAEGPHGLNPDLLNAAIAARKGEAKSRPDKLCVARITPP
ncbi:GGDEF domain-containing protein [Azospirillum oleiclasticum]|nr:GGDEF domain-containing protein [Azospirillum oleiclasticum]